MFICFSKVSLLFKWIGYEESMFSVNLAEHSQIDKEQNGVGELFYFQYFSCGSH